MLILMMEISWKNWTLEMMVKKLFMQRAYVNQKHVGNVELLLAFHACY